MSETFRNEKLLWKHINFSKYLKLTFCKVLLYFVVLLIAIWILAPFAWLVISSFSYKIELLNTPLKWLPSRINLEHYKNLFSSESAIGEGMSFFVKALINSSVVTILATVISMSFGTFGAYAIARLRFKGRNVFLLIMMASYMVPPIMVVIPGYLILRALSLYDTRIGLTLVYVSFILPLVIWILRGFFSTISEELEEAARIDGCTRIGALFRIILPISTPGLVSAFVFCFIASWNEYLYAFIYTSMKARTIPVLIGEFTTKVGINYLQMAAAGVLACLPPVILAMVFQKFLIHGLTEGAVKG